MRRLTWRHVRRGRGGFLLAGVVALGLLGTIPASTSAQELVTFEAVAAADGLRIEVRTPNLLVSNLFDGGVPVAQATANGSGRSTGFAAVPYPGETPLTLPGLLLPILGLPSLPDYPLLASSNHPAQPERVVEVGAFTARSRSDDRGTVAAVTGGVDAGGTTVGRIVTEARAEAEPTSGTVTASARTTVEGASILGLLRLGRIHSEASVTRTPSGDGDVVRSTFEIEPFRIGDLRVALTPDGLEVLGAGGLALPVDSLDALLAPAGIELQLLEATEVEGGVISAGLEISMPSPLPEPLDGGTITITYGRVRAIASATGPTPVDVDPEIDAGPIDLGTTGGGVDQPAFTGGIPDLAGGPAAAPGTVPLERGLRPVASTESAASVYLALVLGAVVAVAGAVLFRYLALKVVWTS